MIKSGIAKDVNGHDCLKRVYSAKGKSPTVTTQSGGNRHVKVSAAVGVYRKLIPLECERLQTLEDNYTEGVSDAQRFRAIGNGFTIDVIVHFLEALVRGDLKRTQTNMFDFMEGAL